MQSKYLSYSKMESILAEIWNETYPVPFRKILKRNINGKGILLYREKNRTYYIYTFLVSIPSYRLQDRGEVVALEEEREILVKFFYEPSNKEKPYSIRMGELDEEKPGRGLIRYIQ